MWSVTGWDWNPHSPEKIAGLVRRKVSGGVACEFAGARRRAVSRGDVHLVGNAEFLQRPSSLAHDLQVGVAAHDDGDHWLRAHVVFLMHTRRGFTIHMRIRDSPA